MNILIVGSGGREHALAWHLRKSKKVKTIYCAPGNGGTEEAGDNVACKAMNNELLLRFALESDIGLTVVGSEVSLAEGIVDAFQAKGLRIFGPTREAARFESSKIFAKEFMQRHGIPTASCFSTESFSEAVTECSRRFEGGQRRVVIKSDGLASGKGVEIASSFIEARSFLKEISGGSIPTSSRKVLIEDFLEGEEISIHAVLDGRDYLLFPAAKDYKRRLDGNKGENTGGMGAFSSNSLLSREMVQEIKRYIMNPFMKGLKEEGIDYRGVLYPGIILTASGPYVLEFNCRFGDPEAQVLLPRLQSDLLNLLLASIDGNLSEVEAKFSDQVALIVNLVSEGYPRESKIGRQISNIEAARRLLGVRVFHAGTRREGSKILTSGGRVLGVMAMSDTLKEARELAYCGAEKIAFKGVGFRSDIGLED